MYLIDKLSKHITELICLSQIPLYVCKQGERDGKKKKKQPSMSVLEDQNKLSLEKDKTMCNLKPLKVSTLSESVFLCATLISASLATGIYSTWSI